MEADLDVRPMRLQVWRRRKQETEASLLLDKETAHHDDEMHLIVYAHNQGTSEICVTLATDDDEPKVEVDTRTEAQVAADPLHPADPISLWMAVRCLRTGLVSVEIQMKMAQRITELWMQTPLSFHPALIDALSHFDGTVLGSVASKSLRKLHPGHARERLASDRNQTVSV